MHLAPLPLLAEEIQTLEACALHARHPRQRRRAQAILGHHRGQSLSQLAAFYAVRYATVQDWLAAWRAHGLVGLVEGKRSGRPRKVADEVKKSSHLAGAGHPAAAYPAAAPASRVRP